MKNLISRPTVLWYSPYLRILKQYKRNIEHLYLNDKSGILKAVYKGVRDSCTSALSAAKDKYYQNVVGGTEGNVKQLYKVTSTLLG